MKNTTAIFAAALFATSALAAPVDSEKRQSFPSTSIYDDASSVLTYSAGWTHLTNQGYNLYDKTESYTGVNGEVRIPNGVYGDQRATLTIYSTKKHDRGAFNVYCGHNLIGSGNQYSSGGETHSQVVAKFENYLCEEDYLVMKNDRGAKYMAFDYLEFSGFNAP